MFSKLVVWGEFLASIVAMNKNSKAKYKELAVQLVVDQGIF